MNKFSIILFIFFVYVGSQIFTFFQLQGHIWNRWIKDNPFLMSLLGVPVGYLVIIASRHMVSLLDGETWPTRIFGFIIGVIVFAIMSTIYLREPLTTKTILCLFLCFIILLIQLFWK
jgi:hypothetical protein